MFLAAVLASTLMVPGCKPHKGDLSSPTFAETSSALDIYERLEALIDQEKDTKQDREDAYALVVARAGDAADDHFARAAIAGRLAENRGLQALGLVTESEDYARRCRAIDPDYREGAATVLLGSLYVLAPGNLVKHGDSETGLEMLEAEVTAHPDRTVARLRLAEAYIALGDPDPASEHLCVAKAAASQLSPSNQRLLTRLLADAPALACDSPASQPPPASDGSP